MNNLRIGFGYDIHRLVKGNSITIGGVNIPHNLTTDAHSDGDVLIHAICDAMLGALALNDIGYYFPNTDEQYKNISSLILLDKTNEIINNQGYRVNNIDTTIVTETPKIRDYAEQMKENISKVLNIHINQISIKATTNEKLGYIGNKEGIAAFAVVTIVSK